MTANEIRQSFFEYFRSKGHQIVPSVPVIPQGDPTLLFTNAGMNPFKDIFLGFRAPEHKRVANSQKCIRVSGKHNDLEEVGVDTYHHTFFEMLGNWSFGDYYKEESITWAWDLLTKVWGLPKDKLYATVHHTDDEAMGLWKKATDINPAHVLKFGDKDNFWEMGETGPCGPCSEIHIDLGPEVDPDPKAAVNSGSPRYREIWNLVFMQHNRRPDRKLDDLKSKHVDTGMGFERIASIIQGKSSNYDSDVFTPVLRAVESLSGVPYAKEEDKIAMRVIADHLRALSFSIADGVTPSNEGRGYVMRRILRRALRYGRKLELKDPFMHRLVDVLAGEMGGAYPELVKQKALVTRTLLAEEEAFIKTLDRGLELFSEVRRKAEAAGRKAVSGEDAFTLYDTYGFPWDLTALLAREAGLSVDEAGFKASMEAQRERSRAKVTESTFELTQILTQIPQKTEYLGETETACEGKLLAIVKDKAKVEALAEGDEAALVFDRSVFYGESGGQAGDRGRILSPEGRFRVEDVKRMEGYFLHLGVLEQGRMKSGEACRLEMDAGTRRDTRKNHSATHLLQKALRTVLGEHVKQAGSQVGGEKLRFDFNHFSAVAEAELRQVEALVNEAILANHPVDVREMKKAEAEASGAMAFFGEKYGEVVRVVNMGGGHSVELCGGSHVGATGEIGSFRILSESSSASGIRRIEAVTGRHALAHANEDRRVLRELARQFQVADREALLQRIHAVLAERKELEKKLGALSSAGLKDQVDALPTLSIGGLAFIYGEFKDVGGDALREQVDRIRNAAPAAVVFLASATEGKLVFVCGVGKEALSKAKAGDLVKKAALLTGGGGGGRPDFAQAGGKDLDALPKVRPEIEKALGG
ncbi:MAG: alanine--tRNA ligase [Spirochaetes bacterium]|nr:alanine--tRNA ligase [Spirochaetota bacterium]